MYFFGPHADYDARPRPLLHCHEIDGLRILQGCDHHFELNLAGSFITALCREIHHQTFDALVLNGDFFNTPGGESAQSLIGDMLRAAAL